MKRLLIAALVAAIIVGSASTQQYDRALVVKTMQSNAALMGQISSASNQKDYFLAAEKLVEIAQGMIRLVPLAPPKGDKAEWEKTIKAFLVSAYKAIGAAGNQDAAGLQAAVGEMKKWNQTGHAMFR